MKLNQIVIVFDGMPGPTMPRFVEVEDGQGRSILAGTWRQRDDGKAELVIQNDDAGDGTSLQASARLAVMYLASGFIECPRCGHEVESKDTDAEYELRGALAAIPLLERDAPDLKKEAAAAKREADTVETLGFAALWAGALFLTNALGLLA